MNQRNDNTVAHQAADAVDQVADDVRSAVDCVDRSVRSAANSVRNTAGRAAGAVHDYYDHAGDMTRDTVHRGLARAQSYENSFEDRVRENPKTSLLIAAAVGAMIFACWRHR